MKNRVLLYRMAGFEEKGYCAAEAISDGTSSAAFCIAFLRRSTRRVKRSQSVDGFAWVTSAGAASGSPYRKRLRQRHGDGSRDGEFSVAAQTPPSRPSAKAHHYYAAFFRSADALLPPLKRGAPT